MNKAKYLILALAFTVIMGIGFPVYNYTIFEPAIFNQLVAASEQNAIRITRHLAREVLSETSEGLDNSQITSKVKKINQHKEDLGLWKLKIFSPKGQTLFSTTPEDIGKVNSKPYFWDIVAQGKPFSKLVTKTNRSMEDEEVSADVVETYVPIMKEGRFYGAFEIYYDVTGRKTAMKDQHRRSTTLMSLLTVVLLSLLFLLGFMIKKTADKRSQTEKALQNQAALLETMLSAVPTPIFFKDAKGFYLGCNKAFEDFHDLPKEQIIGKTIHDFAPKNVADTCYETDQQLFREGKTKVYESQVERADSSIRNVLFHKAVFKKDDRRVGGLVGALVDITEQKRIEQVVKEERAFLQSIIDGALDPLFVIAPDYKVLLMNNAAKAYLTDEDIEGKTLRCHQVSHHSDFPCSGSEHPCPLEEVRRTGQHAKTIHRHTLPNGEVRTLELLASPLWNRDGTLQAVIEASRDITERVEAEASLRGNEERLKHLAHHDALTGLPNRLLFQDHLQQAMAKSRRSEQQVALLFLDLDRFKNINDSLGHEAGDTLLKEVAARLKSCVRETDTVARLGGDEFVVILEQFKEVQNVATVAQKILKNLQRTIVLKGTEFHITSSIGIGLYPADAVDVDGLMKCADSAMYGAKKQGRNNYQFYTPDMNARTHEFLLLENDLGSALEQGELFATYQPQVDLNSGKLIGLETLLRWQHPRRGLVSPADFIPLVEETGLIVPIGEWVLQTACAQNKAWQDQGHGPVRIAVNVSGRQFKQPGFVDMVDRVLAETGLDPRWLELEITENVIMENYGDAIMTLTDLKVRGIHLSIDDFGTGYSSLRYLKHFPISKLKIDRSFVQDISSDSDVDAIVSSIIVLGHNMNLEVIAEGIETEAQLRFLRERDCEQGQGYLFSRPLPPQDVEFFFGKSCLPLTHALPAHGTEVSGSVVPLGRNWTKANV